MEPQNVQLLAIVIGVGLGGVAAIILRIIGYVIVDSFNDYIERTNPSEYKSIDCGTYSDGYELPCDDHLKP